MIRSRRANVFLAAAVAALYPAIQIAVTAHVLFEEPDATLSLLISPPPTELCAGSDYDNPSDPQHKPPHSEAECPIAILSVAGAAEVEAAPQWDAPSCSGFVPPPCISLTESFHTHLISARAPPA